MSDLDPFFKFNIGDIVRPTVQRFGYTREGHKFTPQMLVVVERFLIECYGGIQASYRLRTHTAFEIDGVLLSANGYSFVAELIELTEPELTAAELPELTPDSPAPRRRSAPTGDPNATV